MGKDGFFCFVIPNTFKRPMRKIHKITNIALIFMLIGVVCQGFAYSLPSSREILRVPFDVKYGRLKTLQKIIQTVNQIDNYKIEKENIEKLATKATKYPQYTQVNALRADFF